ERHQPTLAGRIYGLAGGAHAGRVRSDVHDAPCLAAGHERQYGMVHVQCAGEVDVDEPGPVLGGRLDEWLEYVPAGVVDQDVDRPEILLDRRHCRVDLFAVGDVATEGGRAATVGDDGVGDGLRRFQVDVEHGDFCTLGGEAVAG